ncbi:sec-independent protein translocase protein TATA, chloroplastic-like [Ipomoea triloba]|uniref:sec-independent protein translocase protein TATA, chloroplastic-like n=1 Tax=Ipomoea triloba TaxID=35885 RepID=UPI00125D7786|nr:sec-independent protein translocase protein TATA, chloroplastic-like [Ipomoea triloba]
MAAIASAASAVSLSFAPKPASSAVAFSSSSSLSFSSNPGGLKRSLGLRTGNVRSNGRKRLYCKCLFGLGVPEMVVIAGVAALIFGPKQLPEIGRSIGKTVKSFQQAAKEFETELKKEPDELPVQNVKEGGQEEKPDAVVSSTKES